MNVSPYNPINLKNNGFPIYFKGGLFLYQFNFKTPNNGFCIMPIDNQSQRMRVTKLLGILITNRYYLLNRCHFF